MAEAARDLGHRYWALTDHSPRLTVAHGLDAEPPAPAARGGRRPQRRAGPVPHPHRDRGRHPGGRLARPGRGAAGPSSTWSWPACTPSSGWTRRSMTRRMLRAVESPHTDILGHCTGPDPGRPGPPPVDLRRRGRLRGLRPHRHRGRDQLPPRAPRPARGPARAGAVARVRGGHRHRRPRAGPARVAAPRLRAGRAGRRARRPGDEHPARGRLPGLDGQPRGAEGPPPGPTGVRSAGDAPRRAPGLADAGQADPGAARGRRPVLRAEVGRVPLHRLPGRRRGRAGQPQREAAHPVLPRAGRRARGQAARPLRASTARS